MQIWNDITYFFKRKYEQIKRVIDFLPMIWNGFDFDYHYSIELFKHSLQRQANYMNSDKAYTLNSKMTARKIQTAIDLMGKVYDDEYAYAYQEKIKKLYGDTALDFNFDDLNGGIGYSELVLEYEKWDNSKEIGDMHNKLLVESRDKQKRAHKLLWDFIEHNITGFWD